MNPQINEVLESIRKQVEDQEAWGPGSAGASQAGQAASPGEGGANNPSDIFDALDGYLTDIIDLLMVEFDVSEEEAGEFVLDIAEMMTGKGDMPALPGEGAGADAVTVWMGRAKSIGFASHVLQIARESVE